MPITYVKHPLDPKEKKKLISEGYKILDIKFKPKDEEPKIEKKSRLKRKS